jgi:hypothetical protein
VTGKTPAAETALRRCNAALAEVRRVMDELSPEAWAALVRAMGESDDDDGGRDDRPSRVGPDPGIYREYTPVFPESR